MSDRMLRVNSILREVLAEEIERMSDARLEMVSVVSVETAPNLRTAMVYIDVLGHESEADALAALRGAARRLQSTIGSQVRMKYTPTLEFQIDPGITGGERIDQLLRELHDGEEFSETTPSRPEGTVVVPPHGDSGAAAGGTEPGGEFSETAPSRPEGMAVVPPHGDGEEE